MVASTSRLQADTSAPGGAPSKELGANFDRPAPTQLLLATKARVWGDSAPDALEPTEAAGFASAARTATLAQHAHRCMFCTLESLTVEVHNINHNHGDLRDENLGAADPLCHRWQHLGELGKGNALLVYLPGLSPIDASHFLRTTMVALLSDDEATKRDAQKLLNWMASHHTYVDEAWGTSDPSAFANALIRTAGAGPDHQAISLANLALVVNPATLQAATARWRAELLARRSESGWPALHHDLINAPT